MKNEKPFTEDDSRLQRLLSEHDEQDPACREALVQEWITLQRGAGFGLDAHMVKQLDRYVAGELDLLSLHRALQRPYLH